MCRARARYMIHDPGQHVVASAMPGISYKLGGRGEEGGQASVEGA